MEQNWKPKYMDRYYTVEQTEAGDYEIKKYMWLDLDDDERTYACNNVYRDYEAASASVKRRRSLDSSDS